MLVSFDCIVVKLCIHLNRILFFILSSLREVFQSLLPIIYIFVLHAAQHKLRVSNVMLIVKFYYFSMFILLLFFRKQLWIHLFFNLLYSLSDFFIILSDFNLYTQTCRV